MEQVPNRMEQYGIKLNKNSYLRIYILDTTL